MDCRTGFQFTEVRHTPRTMCRAVRQAQGHSSELPLGPGCMRCAAAHPPEGLAPGNSACSGGEARRKTAAATGQRAGLRHEPLQGPGFCGDLSDSRCHCPCLLPAHSRSRAVEPQAKQGSHWHVSRKPSLASKKKSPGAKRWLLDRL